MGNLPAVLEVESRMEAARLAQQEAEQAGAEFNKAWRAFEDLPKKFEKVQGYLANVNQVLADLEAPSYDQQI
jgi:tRNA A58 N-methylase Trm61